MQAIYDLDVKFTNKSSSYSVRLWNQICNFHVKLKYHQSVQSSLTHQTFAYIENEKNIKLHNQMNMQLSRKLKDITNIWWINEWHARDKCRHITEILHFIDFLSILQRKFNQKCKALKIKIKVLNFVNNINILVYDKFIEEICKTLSKVHDICTKWACTHDVMFASEKYKLMHFTRKLKKFNMMINIQIKSLIIKSKSDVWVLKMQLNMKLQWDVHFW